MAKNSTLIYLGIAAAAAYYFYSKKKAEAALSPYNAPRGADTRTQAERDRVRQTQPQVRYSAEDTRQRATNIAGRAIYQPQRDNR